MIPCSQQAQYKMYICLEKKLIKMQENINTDYLLVVG